MSFHQPSPAAITVYSHVRHQPSAAVDIQNSTTLNRSKKEILRIVELMIEKTQQEVIQLLLEVMTRKEMLWYIVMWPRYGEVYTTYGMVRRRIRYGII